MQVGIVYKSTGSSFIVLASDDRKYTCRLKGSFRIKGIKTTNPVAVGDRVKFDLPDNHGTGLIREILHRENYIIRKATKMSKVSHIIAANIDQVCVLATPASPRTSMGFIDRVLVTAEAYHIPGLVVYNKIDIYTSEQEVQVKEWCEIYSEAGYKTLRVSALRRDNLDLLKHELFGKTTLLTGHSGVGKSALINAIEPGLNLKTQPISDYHQKGTHTTTFAEMLPLTGGGFLIDTPGIKEFGLTDFNRSEIAERFPEMRKFMHDCRFNNCSHIHEPGCAVIEALEQGLIRLSRYENYLSILNDDYWEKMEKDYRL